MARGDRRHHALLRRPGGARTFYRDIFGLPVFFEDESSTVFRFGDTLVNLLRAGEAPELVNPAAVAPPDAGVRFQFTLSVEDVDAMCEELRQRGVALLNGPIDRPWGVRAAGNPAVEDAGLVHN